MATPEQPDTPTPPTPPTPKDVVDGIADRSANRPLWKYLLVAAVFVGWLGVLITLYLLGRR